ncbi:MAG: agmatine deiminase family protein, partial [Pseudobdellovibrio sp.]
DEVVKPIGNNTILTNTPEYANDFKAWGYNVVLLPDVPDSYRTYANSLIVGKTVFMPTYGLASDKQAQAVYEGLGYKVFGIPSNSMSDDMHGSVHCQTMAYPAVNEQQLMQFLNLEKIN